MISDPLRTPVTALTEEPFERFFMSIVHAVIILGAFAIPAFFLRTLKFGADLFSVFQWILYPLMVVMLIFQKRIPFRIFVWLFIWAMWLLGATSLFKWGVLGNAEIVLTGMLITVGISQDKKKVLLLVSVTLLLYLAAGTLVVKGIYRPPADLAVYFISLQGWIITGIIFIIFIGTLAERTGWMFREIAISNSRIEAENQSLSEEIDRRIETQKNLEKMTARKEALLQDVHHRVKSNLQIISGIIGVQAATSSSPDVKRITKTTEGRIQSMSTIHEILYQSEDLSKMNLKILLESLCLNIEKAFGLKENNIALSTSLEETEAPIEIAVPFALIINEVINNSIIHGFPESVSERKITVTLSVRESREIQAEVQDSGKGIGDALKSRHSTSMGYDLIDIISGEMGARYEVFEDNGTVFRISFST